MNLKILKCCEKFEEKKAHIRCVLSMQPSRQRWSRWVWERMNCTFPFCLAPDRSAGSCLDVTVHTSLRVCATYLSARDDPLRYRRDNELDKHVSQQGKFWNKLFCWSEWYTPLEQVRLKQSFFVGGREADHKLDFKNIFIMMYKFIIHGEKAMRGFRFTILINYSTFLTKLIKLLMLQIKQCKLIVTLVSKVIR